MNYLFDFLRERRAVEAGNACLPFCTILYSYRSLNSDWKKKEINLPAYSQRFLFAHTNMAFAFEYSLSDWKFHLSICTSHSLLPSLIAIFFHFNPIQLIRSHSPIVVHDLNANYSYLIFFSSLFHSFASLKNCLIYLGEWIKFINQIGKRCFSEN